MKVQLVTQAFPGKVLDDLPKAVIDAMNQEFGSLDLQGRTIALCLSSRGISNYALIVYTVAEWFRQHGAECFGVPAMGSHGGATKEGQLHVLDSYGITPSTMGMPINGEMATMQVGTADGVPVFVARSALQADFIFPINRIKPHTQIYQESLGSGCLKMLAIGLGKLDGPSGYHASVTKAHTLGMMVRAAGLCVLEKCAVLGGLGIVENAQHETACVGALSRDIFFEQEAELYAEACRLMPSLPFMKIGVLVIGRIGKSLSGSGMDPNITGRFWFDEEPRPGYPDTRHIAVMDRYGPNYLGIGFADSCNTRVYEGVDPNETVVNAVTGGRPELAEPPPIRTANDFDLFDAALNAAGMEFPLVLMKDTLTCSPIYVSDHGKRVMRPDSTAKIQRKLIVPQFNSDHNLVHPSF